MSQTQWTATHASSPFRRLLPLTGRSRRALDRAFSDGEAVIPDTVTTGIGLSLTGTWFSWPLAWFFWPFWKGKIFDASGGRMINRILPFDVAAIGAAVGPGTSLFDGRPCTVIDYSQHRFIGWMFRDEIREIEPGTYLGLTFVLGRCTMKFALTEHGDGDGAHRS
jgi:hypothetical protein